MSSTNEAQEPTSADEVRQRYREMIAAREDYQRAQGGQWEGAMQRNYHDAVFNLYAELRGRLKHRDLGQELWEEAELWPLGEEFFEAAICPQCAAVQSLEEENVAYQPGDTCPNCREAALEHQSLPKTDENGEVVYQWETGLKELGKYRNRVVQYTKEYSDGLGTHEETVTERDLLEPYQLEVVADLFGEAMEVLGLYPDAEASKGIQTDEIR